MSTSLKIYLESLDWNNYVSLMVVTVVTYDYALTFSSEIEHIWKRRWTWISSAFLLYYRTEYVRFSGSWLIGTDYAECQAGSSFVPGPLWLLFHWQGKAFFYLANWTGFLFTCAADLVMIFRVYALYGKSKKILAFLLFIYSGEVVASAIAGVVYTIPGNTLMTIPPAPYPSVCELQYASWNWGRYSVIPQVVLQGVMCLLAIYQSLKQSLHLYKATKRWQFNQYFKLLVNQGLLYFLMWVFAITTPSRGKLMDI
ncbi:hypothetical protein HD554DRAFT_2266872 [Boletus coccyginus]|nr:hypothetical protein HD554DRAFT_2266872 [Boletus coccyginus]